MKKLPWIIIALLIAALVLSGYLAHRYRMRSLTLAASVQREQLEALGWRAVATQHEMDLDRLKDQVAKDRPSTGTKPALSARVIGRETAVEIPLPATPCPPPSLLPSTSSTPPHETATGAPVVVASQALTVSTDLQLQADLLKDGSMVWIGSQVVVLKGSNPSFKREITLPIDDSSALSTGPALQKAIDSYMRRSPRLTLTPRPLREWRVGWTLGPACGIMTGGGVDCGVMVGYGLSF